MVFKNDRQRRAAFYNMNKFSESIKKPTGISLSDNIVPDWVVNPVNKETKVDVNKLNDADYLLKVGSSNQNQISGDASTIDITGKPIELIVKTDPKKLKELDDIFKNVQSHEPFPDYTLETWQKEVAGVKKYKIDEYYRNIWNVLEPQLKDRNVLVRYAYDGEQVVKRHPPGSKAYTTINSEDDMSEIVREHGIEIWNETSKKGDLDRGDLAVLDIDNLEDVPERKMKKVTKSIYDNMGKSFGHKPYIINTHGGYHIGVKLDKPIPFKTMRNKMDKEVIGPVEDEFEGLVSRHHGKAPIYADKTPEKKHGSSKVVGSLNLPDLTITEKIPIEELDSFRRTRLK